MVKFKWVFEFENEFNLENKAKSKNILIIEGLSAYKQRLGKINFVTKVPISCPIYNNFSEVAFLVTDWIKIQDSLEMIFNLLTGDSVRSLKVLSYLRKEQIPAHEFACYLYENYNLILINRFNNNNNSQYSNLMTFINFNNNNNINIKFLMVGKERNILVKVASPFKIVKGDKPNKSYVVYAAYTTYMELKITLNKFPIINKNLKILINDSNNTRNIKNKVANFAKILHSSGTNLNKSSSEYNKIWYKLDDNGLIDRKGNISLSDFTVLK